MSKKFITASLLIFILVFPLNSQVKFSLDVNNKGIQISPVHYGIFFEDINHAADGGLYAELIRNRSFEDAKTPDYWTTYNKGNANTLMMIDSTNLLNSSQKKDLKWVILKASDLSKAGVYNSGFWGIDAVNGRQYTLSFFAKCDAGFSGSIFADLENANGTVISEQASVTGLTSEWQKFTCTFKATGDDSYARLALYTNSVGIVWLDVVSLFPPTFKDRPNGCRPDLAQKLADLHPKFMRFPGGCFVEGDVLANRYQWKKSIGNIENRPGHNNLWGYRTTDGMGFHEFLQLSEDIGAKPLFVINVGLAHNDNQPVNSLDWYIQDALDALEYANGDVSTTYGAMRAANGHPEPFNIEYIEIGNENFYGDNYGNRYIQFYNAIKARYPNIQCIGNVAAWGTDTPSWTFSYPVDLVDEHYYRDPTWFINQYKKYDNYDRNGPKVYIGEYAVTSGCGTGNLIAAIGEAVYMCGMEKNSDIVPMNSYAPIFVNTNNRAWNPDMIVYNSSQVYGTPSYYVQNMFYNNLGTVSIPMTDSLNYFNQNIEGTGNVGLGTWSTKADYTDLKVTDSKGNTVASEPFSSTNNWTSGTGTWSLSDVIYSQTSTLTDCRSIQQTQITDSTYTYSLKARKTGGNEGFLIIFGYKDSNNFYWWNIGGWGNTQHAIEHCVNGTKTTVVSASGSITSNVWYDIKIEVSNKEVRCYLNNTLIHTLSAKEVQKLYTSATLDETNNHLIVKVVNPNDFNVNAKFIMKNIPTQNIPVSQTILTAASKQDENSFASPMLISPQVSNFVSTDTLSCSFTSNSVNVLKIDLTNNQNGIPNLKLSNKKLKILPNPAKKKVQIFCNDNNKLYVSINDLKGHEVFNSMIGKNDAVDLSGFAPGIYVVKATNSNNEIESGKLIIQ